LEKQLAATEKELSKFIDKGDEAFEDLKAGFVAAVSEMQNAVKKALARF
jgi:hypothetical protein